MPLQKARKVKGLSKIREVEEERPVSVKDFDFANALVRPATRIKPPANVTGGPSEPEESAKTPYAFSISAYNLFRRATKKRLSPMMITALSREVEEPDVNDHPIYKENESGPASDNALLSVTDFLSSTALNTSSTRPASYPTASSTHLFSVLNHSSEAAEDMHEVQASEMQGQVNRLVEESTSEEVTCEVTEPGLYPDDHIPRTHLERIDEEADIDSHSDYNSSSSSAENLSGSNDDSPIPVHHLRRERPNSLYLNANVNFITSSASNLSISSNDTLGQDSSAPSLSEFPAVPRV
ncbi:hypothetical protein MMC19_005896 [Ptychographa xylographoides]|nr:hypothetical protein [Ptychographa xylographoides]